MTNKGKNLTQTMSDTVAVQLEAKEQQLSRRRGLPSHYKAQSAEHSEAQLKKRIAHHTTAISEFDIRKKFKLGDADELKERIILYLKACEETASFPSSIGLSHALGYTDRALRHWRSHHPETPTAQLLEQFSELCADTLAQSALKNDCNVIMAIFTNKAQYSWREQSEIIVKPGAAGAGMEESEYSADEIRARYLLDYGEASDEE